MKIKAIYSFLTFLILALAVNGLPASPESSVENHAHEKVTEAAAYDGAWITAASVTSAPNAHSVLILSTTNGREADTANDLGLTPVVVTPENWAKLTPADFASYRAIILGDKFCTDVSAVAAAEANVNIWSSIIKGNVIIDGTDPSFHILFGGNFAGAQNYQSAAIAYAASSPALTGAYISLSCYYAFLSPSLVKVLSGFGEFTVQGSSTCDGNQRIVNPHPGTPLVSLTDEDLRNWFCSTHEFFTSYPSGFAPFAILDDPSVSEPVPYILTREANCCLGTYTGSACCNGSSGSDVFVCVDQIPTKINTCSAPVSKCNNVALGVVDGLLVQSAVCNV